ncbi:Pyoverdine/dityrosine biosynthesis protein-domain-containing protein [Nemania sp. FL0916]|nr:Pyoverdine/dityrosine biosynthesis protein-domain-containing protein [Nemania sp. FL0916]
MSVIQVNSSLSSDDAFLADTFDEKQLKSFLFEEVRELSLTPSPSPTPAHDLDSLASDILDVVQSYGQHLPSQGCEDSSHSWIGKPFFMAQVKAQVEKCEAVHLILPAFPWKSVNRIEKVIGKLPDLGEEIALFRLNQLCEDIKAIYPPGGKVFIATDGVVFDDVVGIPDEDTWEYGEGLKAIVQDHGLDNIQLLRVMDILGYTKDKPLDKAVYLALAQKCREEILSSYGRTEEEVRQMMKEDPDTLLTYCGFIRFLESDLKYSPVTADSRSMSGHKYRKTVKKVAIQMMIRAESFTKLLQAHCSGYVRLSIHPSSGSVKLSIPLIIQSSGDFPRSPWHSSLALAIDGSYSMVHAKDVCDTHDLITKDGRGYYFREKSSLWDLGPDITCEPRYPNTLVVRPTSVDRCHGGETKLSADQMNAFAALKRAHTAGPVLLAGFSTGTDESFRIL